MDTINTALEPIKALFRDRVFVTALLSALGAVIVSLVPALEPYIGQVIAVAVTLVILAAGGNVVMSAVNKITDAKTEQANIELQIVQAQTARTYTYTPSQAVVSSVFDHSSNG